MEENDLKILMTEFLDNKCKYFTKELAYELFSGIDDYNKPVDKLKKEDFFSNFKK